MLLHAVNMLKTPRDEFPGCAKIKSYINVAMMSSPRVYGGKMYEVAIDRPKKIVWARLESRFCFHKVVIILFIGIPQQTVYSD